MVETRRCPECGAELPPHAPEGMCPKCLLEGGLGDDDDQETLGVETAAADAASILDARADVHEEQLPAEISGYRIVRLIGTGGMGAVYEAEQEHPHRTVALKVLRPGFATRQLLRRFEHEAEVLGRLEHPGIARIYESGTAEAGGRLQPFFAMQIIRGPEGGKAPTLTEYAEQQQLDTRQRLELLAKVSDAVHYAHQKGIIHRDLKPANILVDGSGQPKILDFGVARITDSDIQATTMQTDVGQIIGTLPYMSPEQAAGAPADLDIRSDVYALGVICYELLAGHLPYALERQMIHEAVRIIREEEPTRLSSINRTFRGDIETIVFKSLEKEKDRRYQSASDLATDIRRYLNDEPIVARRPSAWYQLGKFTKRNKILVGGMAGVFVALVLGIIGTSMGMLQARHAQRAAEAARQGETDQRRRAEERLAAGLVFAGDSLTSSGRFWRARQSYKEAWGIAQRLGLSEVPASTGLLGTCAVGPPPLMGTDGREGGISGFLADTAANRCPVFSPNGRMAVSGSADKTLKLWDLATGLAIRTFGGHADTVTVIAFSPDGRTVLSGSSDRTLKLWDVATGTEIRTFEGHTGVVKALAFAPDGQTAISASPAGEVKTWDVGSGKEILSVSGPSGSIYCMAFSPDRQRLLSGGWVWAVELWDVKAGERIRKLVGHRNPVDSLTFSPDGREALTGSWDNTIKLWDVSTGKEIRTFSGHMGRVYSVAFSPDERVALSGSQDQTLRLWSVATGEQIGTLAGHASPVRVARFSPDGRFALTAGEGETLKLWLIQKDREITTFSGHRHAVQGVAVAPDGLTAISGGYDKTVKFWDVATGMEIRTLTGHRNCVRHVAFSPDGRIAASASAKGAVKLWDLTTGREIRSFPGGKDCVAFAPDGRALLSATHDGPLKLWDVTTGKGIRTFMESGRWVADVALSHDGRYALSVGATALLTLWDVATAREIRSFQKNPWTYSVAFSPDDRTALAGDAKGVLTLWDVATGTEVRTFTGHGGAVEGVAFAPDGRTARSVSWDGTVRVWDVASGRQIRKFAGHSNRAFGVAVSADGRRTFSASWDRTVKVWDFGRPERYREFEALLPKARETLARDPDDPEALAAFGRWHAFRGVDDWAADLLERARRGGAGVSDLTLGRCYWRLGKLAEAERAFRRAAEQKEAPAGYLSLCVGGLRRARIKRITDAEPEQQRRLLGDLKAQLAAKAERALTLDDAMLMKETARALEVIGNPDLAAEACRSFAELIAKTKDKALTNHAAMLDGVARRLTLLGREMEVKGTRTDGAELDWDADRGKVVSLEARGQELDRLLEQLIGPPYAPTGKLTFIDVQSKANQKLTEQLHNKPDNDLSELPQGEQTFAGVRFKIVDALIQLAGTHVSDRPKKIEAIPVNTAFGKLYIFHGTGWGAADGVEIGQYKVHYEDETTETVPIVFGEDVRGWNYAGESESVKRGCVAWVGCNAAMRRTGGSLRLYLTMWENPRPDKKVVSIDYISAMTNAAPFCVAMTIEQGGAGPNE